MKKHAFSLLFLVFISLLLLSCDSTNAPDSLLADTPSINSIQLSPSQVQFSLEDDGFKDTTLAIGIDSEFVPIDESQIPYYSVIDLDGNVLVESGYYDQTSNGTTDVTLGGTTFTLDLTTTSFKNYVVEVSLFDESGNGNSVEAYLEISGFSNNPPVILEARNPETFNLPDSGEEVVTFQAKVTDADGQSTIEGVYLRLISRVSGEVSGSPFPLLDNGTGEDEVASDSLYTIGFTLNSENEPQTYDILYYAEDLGGLSSDTVRTTFTITND